MDYATTTRAAVVSAVSINPINAASAIPGATATKEGGEFQEKLQLPRYRTHHRFCDWLHIGAIPSVIASSTDGDHNAIDAANRDPYGHAAPHRNP